MIKSIEKTINIIRSIYDVFLYKIIRYYDPIIEKLILYKPLNINRLIRYNRFKSYNDVNYIYKVQNIEYSNKIYYNLGIIYHTDIIDVKYLIDKELVYFEDDIDNIRIKLLSTNNNEYIIIDDKFVSLILNNATDLTRLEPLLYYYLIKYLQNYDEILEVEFNINNTYIKVDINNKLKDLIKN